MALQSNLNEVTKIYSFEPHPEIANNFSQSVQKSQINNIIIENVAVGETDCNIELNLYGQTSNILDCGFEVLNKTTIKQINLDNYLAEKNIIPNFIKIDVDGYEMQVLKGLKNTILKVKPIIVIETNDDIEVLNFLKSFNYKLLDLDLKEFEGIPNNIFCVSE